MSDLTETDWWDLARTNPVQAIQHPFYDLLLLAEPERWLALEAGLAETWMHHARPTLSEMQQELFACDCAERALPCYENYLYQNDLDEDPRPRTAILARRDLATGLPVSAQWVSARSEMVALSARLWTVAGDGGGGFIDVIAAGWVIDAIVSTPVNAATCAWHALGQQQKERIWQWRRILDYVFGRAM